jgi:hypothetical protein
MNTANPMGRGANTLIAKKKREQKKKKKIPNEVFSCPFMKTSMAT